MSNARNMITGRSAFLALLKSEGITHLFGNPGTTELPVMDGLKDHPDLKYVLALQEALVLAMADGYSRASGELVACNVHVAPGLGNAMGSLYNAKFTGTPMIVTAGQQEIGHGLTEPLLYDPLVPIAEPLVKWATEVHRIEDLPRIVRRAAKIATTAPTGPVFISLPGDILNAEAGLDLMTSTRVDTRVRPSDAALDALARRLIAAERPVIIAGDEIVRSDALEVAARFAETIGATVWQQTVPYGAHFLSESPCYIGGLSRDQREVREILSKYDLLIAVGSDPLRMSVMSTTDPKPEQLPIVQLGQVDWDLAKNYSAEIAINADVRETLTALLPHLEAIGGAALASAAAARRKEIAADNWTVRRARLADRIAKSAAKTPIDPDWLALTLVDALPDNAVLVNEALTSGRYIPELYAYRDRFGFHGLASGGIGWAVPGAVGVALAQAPRPVCCYVGDGSAMYSIQALWTAAHFKLPITYVIPNNGGYRILKQRLKAFHGNEHYIGMDIADPPIDFVALATSLGVPGERVTEPAKLGETLARAFRAGGPRLVEVMVEGRV